MINLNANNQRLSNFKNANYNSSLSNLHASFAGQLSKNELKSQPPASRILNSNAFKPNLNSSNASTNNSSSSNNNSISNTSNNSSITSSQLNSSSPAPPQPAEDRYAALRAFFDNESSESKDDALVFNQESNLIKSTSLSKSISSFSGSNALLRENSKELTGHLTNGRQSASNLMSRCESYSSLSTDLRMTPVSICSSRGPSPLTLNNVGSSIPIAAAIQECVSARFQGADESKCKSAVFGILKIAFPTGILQVESLRNLAFSVLVINRFYLLPFYRLDLDEPATG